MKFTLSTAEFDYDNEPRIKLERLGFRFMDADPHNLHAEWYKHHGNIKRLDISYNPTIELSTLEELIALSDEFGYPLIIDGSSIRIYDGYVE